ncbi:TonB-dependent siderophore receptor [Pseudorhodoferax soli]|uniref:Iron complex outermembrane receptor protein/outer membrane receptor for ferric coprogen and ferric-rhodotorulic acid n=1 Tax=Pseudorhodoferax soli TaxID=545864 RepID=A0A368XTF0_9BURK|nr:TonB-dependent siderophore receptor [Pseudorhodoferax soli]RCW71243.1 iron complex outermembrane receptor protein/outer membrane receptor for ferric coprogen and ferric-rhodotorulic acid [Pseudorhodoferax soli]
MSHDIAGPRAATTALALLACCATAAAQALPEVRVTDSDTTTTEGTYTARTLDIGKAGLSPRETPQSVSVITRQQLDDRNLTKLEDALKSTVGVNITRLDGAGNYNSIQARGFDIGAVLLDGLPIAQGPNYATALDLSLYDRVEVLRGPAGLLQGAGEPGGAVNLVRKRALNSLRIGGGAQLGSFGLRRLEADLTGPLNAAGTLRGRVVVVEDRRDSFVDLLFSNKHAAYGTLELDIAPSTTLSVGATRQRVRSMVDQGLPAYATGQLLDVPRSTVVGTRANRQDMDTRDVFAELEHRLGNGGLVKAALRDVRRDNFYRSGRANGAVAANGDFAFETVDLRGQLKDRSADLYLATPFTLAGREHRLLLGVNRNERESGENNYAYGPGSTVNIFVPGYVGMAYPQLRLPGFTATTKRTETALYGQVQFSATERLRLLAGGRLSWAEVEVEQASDGQVTSRSKPGRQFTPNLAALFDLTPQLTAYTSYAESFVVQSQLDSARQLLPARSAKQIEVGLKGEFLNKRLQTQAALFRIDDVNRAMADPVVSTASIPGGEVRSEGLELEASGQVAPGWDVLAGYAYTRTEYLKAPATQLGLAFAPLTPRHVVNLSSRYAFRDGALRGFSVGGGISWRSSFYAQAGALRLVSGNDALANLQLGYAFNDHVELGLTVDNLFDKTYYEKVSGLARQNFYGTPRSAVLALKLRY